MRKTAALLLLLSLLSYAPAARAEVSQPVLSTVVAKVAPSVVGISVVKRVPAEDPGDAPVILASSGSGFVFQKGYILSNAHVLDHALTARIVTHEGKSYPINPAQIWADPVSDLAVAKVDVDLPAVSFASGTKLQLGDPVFAMGAPYGLRFRGSVSRGIISGFERLLGADYTFLQTDAPINPGNSGGPLFDMNGQVVGVNTRGIHGADGMGFSIPAELAREIAQTLIRDRKVERAWLGLRFVEGEEAALGWTDWEGPFVTMVEAAGPAAAADIQVGDSLTRLNGEPVASLDDVALFLRTITPGTPVTMTFGRGDREFDAKIVAGTRPHDADLYRSAGGLWVNLTNAQANLARRFGRELAFVEADDLTAPWTSVSDSARAVLLTEFLQLARASWQLARQDKPMTAAQAEAEAARRRGVLEVQVDVQTRFKLDPATVWAEFQDEGGSVPAIDVRVIDGAPSGYQRLMLSFRSTLVEERGVAVVLLHMDRGTDRRFVFDLDGIH